MTVTFGTNATGDIYLDASGNIAVLSGLAAVEAACVTASKAQLGEMVLSTRKGLPNFQVLWVGVPNIPLWESYMRSTLKDVQGVDRVTALTARQKAGALVYTATIQTQYGTGKVSA